MAMTRNLAEGYIGQEKVSHGVSDSWEKIAGAFRKGTIYQARVSAVDRKYSTGEKANDPAEGAEAAHEGPNLILWIDRVMGVIPYSESSLRSPEDARDIVGQIVAFKVKDIDEQKQAFRASRKEALEQMATLTWKNIEPGQTRVAACRAVTKYRAIADIGGVAVSIPAKEVSYSWVDDVRDYLSVEDTFDVKVVEVDKENKKVSVSIRALLPDPWQDSPEKIPYEGQRALGAVASVIDDVMRINIEPGFVCKCTQRRNGYIRHAKGERVLVQVRRVDPEKRFILAEIIEQRNRSYHQSL